MQPDWLPSQRQRRFVTVGSVGAGLGFLLISGVISGLSPPLISVLFYAPTYGLGPWLSFSGLGSLSFSVLGGLQLALTLGLPAGLIVGLLAYHRTITPTEGLRWTTASLRRNFRRWFVRGGLGGLGISFFFWLGSLLLGGNGLHDVLAGGLAGGLTFGVLFGVLFGLLSGLQTQDYVTPPAPGKAVQVSKRNALLSGLPIGLAVTLGVGLVLGVLSGLAGWMSGGLVKLVLNGWLYGLPVGLGVGFITGLQRGGGAYLRHQVLRRLLVRNRSIPRDYVAFLDYATRLILLRRRGGGYEFVHRLLLEHFAALEPRSWQALPPKTGCR